MTRVALVNLVSWKDKILGWMVSIASSICTRLDGKLRIFHCSIIGKIVGKMGRGGQGL